MTDVANTLEAISKPVRHGVNNLMMVLLGNLDLILRSAPEGSAAARQAGRAKEAAERMATLLAATFGLPRDRGLAVVKANLALEALMPLLETVAGRAIRLDEEALPAVLWPRPEAALALLGWAMEVAAPDVVPVLRLSPGPSGAVLTPSPRPVVAGDAFLAAALASGGTWDGAGLVLPYAP